MRPPVILVALFSVLSATGLAATPNPAVPLPARQLPAPTDVSPRTRQRLKSIMGAHAASMQSLVRAVVLLDRPTIRVLADRIANAKTFAADTTSGLALPLGVTNQGAALAAAARELAFVATTGGGDVLADRFAALTRTCVSCHSSYLQGRGRPLIDLDSPDRGADPREDGTLLWSP